MLVTFHTKAYADITMFGDVAKRLLEFMGLSGTVPSALAAEDVPAALARLRTAVAAAAPDVPAADDDDEQKARPVGIALRAHPLIELLAAASARGCGVSWRGH
ncbi:MAG TPA: DUF1840 domain-containing protein [Gammaproteobacteria bacterium]